MKRKTIICSFVLTALLLGGCARGNTQVPEHSSAPDSGTPSTSTDAAQSTTQSQSNIVPGGNEDGSRISEEEAKRIALSHAGLTADQVTFIKSGIDRDDGRENYDVEFYTQDRKEYDYEIDPYTGEVLDYDFDAEYYTQPSETAEENSITADEAKQIALEQVPGATAQDIREFESNYDNGKLKYEGKIYYDQKEFEFEIDGDTGDVLEWDVESIYDGAS